MRAQFDTEPTLGMNAIEDLFVDPNSRDDIPRMILALQSIWMNCDLRDQIVTYLQKVIGEGTDQSVGRPGLNYWRIFVLAVLKYGLGCDFDRLTELANKHSDIRILLQNDTSDFGHESLYRVQTIINNVSLITDDIWLTLNRMIVDHGLEVFGVASDAPLEARTDSYVVETHVETPHDVRLLRDSIILAMQLASRAWEAFNLGAYDIAGWRQLKHLIITVNNAYLEINTTKKRETNPELVLAFFKICYYRIQKCILVLDKIKELDPSSSRIAPLEKAIEQFNRLVDLVHRRVIEGEKIPNAEKLLSLHAEHTRWIVKGKAMPNQVELGVPVAITQCQHGLILGWDIIWTQSDVDMTIEIATKYRTEFENLGSMSFDRGFWSPQNFEALSAMGIEVILPKKGYKNKIERERESAEEFRRKRRQHAQIESCINSLEQHGGARIRTKGGKAGFARSIGASVVATNLCRIGKVLMARHRESFRQAA